MEIVRQRSCVRVSACQKLNVISYAGQTTRRGYRETDGLALPAAVQQTKTHQDLPTLRRVGGPDDGLAEPVHEFAERRCRAAYDGPKNLVDSELSRQVLNERRQEEEVVLRDRGRRGDGRRRLSCQRTPREVRLTVSASGSLGSDRPAVNGNISAGFMPSISSEEAPCRQKGTMFPSNWPSCDQRLVFHLAGISVVGVARIDYLFDELGLWAGNLQGPKTLPAV